jgi:hypothetical protein
MPHEKIRDRHNRSTLPGEEQQPPQPFLEVGWSSGPTPSSDHEVPDGWVQVSANRDGVNARIANEDPHVVVGRTMDILTGAGMPLLKETQVAAIAQALAPYMQYGFGEPVVQFGIQLDREGCNHAIRTLRRARDRAYGADA